MVSRSLGGSLVVLVLAVPTTDLAAQAAWRNIAQSPSERTEVPFCYELSRGRCILYGGVVGGERRADAWQYSAGRWSQVPVPDGPYLFNPAATSDSRRDRVVLFGYELTPPRAARTLEFDGVRWIDRSPVRAPDSSLHGIEPGIR